jgi:tetratricopeptide (TPR) repeat protein
VRTAWFIMMIGLSAGLYAGPANAQRSDDQAAAEQLFVQGRALMEQGKLDEACRALEASHTLDPAPGTLLNLALCNEKQGKVATAWALYREVENLARREGQAKREATARERARACKQSCRACSSRSRPRAGFLA